MSEASERRLLDPEAHILVVEDDGEMRNLVARLLRDAAYRVSAARDGREMPVKSVPPRTRPMPKPSTSQRSIQSEIAARVSWRRMTVAS